MNTATKVCLDCAKQIPNGADKCPHCGEWQEARARLKKHQSRVNKNFDLHQNRSGALLKTLSKPKVVLSLLLLMLALSVLAYGIFLGK